MNATRLYNTQLFYLTQHELYKDTFFVHSKKNNLKVGIILYYLMYKGKGNTYLLRQVCIKNNKNEFFEEPFRSLKSAFNACCDHIIQNREFSWKNITI